MATTSRRTHMGDQPRATNASQAKYVGVGVALGAGIGTALGVLTGNIGVWLPIGVALGVVIGAGLSRRGGGTRAA
jgi:hypothetical protein